MFAQAGRGRSTDMLAAMSSHGAFGAMPPGFGPGGAQAGRLGSLGKAGNPAAASDRVPLELRTTWWRFSLGLLRSGGPVIVAGWAVTVGLMQVLDWGRQPWWELPAGMGFGILFGATISSAILIKKATLQLDGHRVRRPDSRKSPLLIRVDELDVGRSCRRTLRDRFFGRQRLYGRDGSYFEFTRVWYPAREREEFLTACFTAAAAASPR